MAHFRLVDFIDSLHQQLHLGKVRVANVLVNHLVVDLTARTNPSVGLLSLAEHFSCMFIVHLKQTFAQEEVVL